MGLAQTLVHIPQERGRLDPKQIIEIRELIKELGEELGEVIR